MVQTALPGRMTLEQFLKWDDGTDRRYELFDGTVVPMELEFVVHGLLLANLAQALHDDRAGLVFMIGIGVVPPNREDTWYRTDIIGSAGISSPSLQYVERPRLICEVTSPFTVSNDYGRKLDDYRQIRSLEEILLVSSEQRWVQHWRRRDTSWMVEDLSGDATLRPDLLPASIPLEAIYQGSGV